MAVIGAVTGLTDSLTQVVVPGQETLKLAEPGDYTIFYEPESIVGSLSFLPVT